MKYIDLGLPSGNLWAAENEDGYYTFDKAVEKFGNNLPTKDDFKELLKYCWKRWDDEHSGIEFMGDNGVKLFFPALGYIDGIINDKEYKGYYWSSSKFSESDMFSFNFEQGKQSVNLNCFYENYSIRLIKK